MKKELVLHHKATLVKYNFGQPFASQVKHYQEEPKEDELMEFLTEFNKKHVIHENCETDIEVIKLYKVINIDVVNDIKVIIGAWTNIPGTEKGTAFVNDRPFNTINKGDEFRYIITNKPAATDVIVGRFHKKTLEFDMEYCTDIIEELRKGENQTT